MYLKSLELQGFKSFPDKTKLSFEKGSTVIVGPNGSGKSNISDAMRWVLGEISSKNIRGTKMEDIIFGGADSRRPMGYAEVSVTFDNTTEEGGHLESPYDEVTVTRRYYRAGESEYFINRKPVRLKDIYELFMNTGIGRDGYSIIGQGKIAEIVSKKSDERRSIFEDASGIAKFRHKKSEAERKLHATEENMLRINDILSELEGRVEPLRRESEKAKKYLELYEKKKMADVQLWLFDTEKIRGDISRAESEFKLSEIQLQGIEDSLTALESQNDKLFEESQSNKLISEQLLTKIREQTNINHALDSDFKVGETNIAHTKEFISGAEASRDMARVSIEREAEAMKSHIEKEEELNLRLAALAKEQEDNNRLLAEYTSSAESLEDAIATSLDDIRQLEAERVDIKVRISVLENAKSKDKDKNTSILSEIEEYNKASEILQKKCEDARQSLEKYNAELENCKREIKELEEKKNELQRRHTAQLEERGRAMAKRDSFEQRIDALRRMEEHFEGYNNSVRFVMKQYEAGAVKTRTGSSCGKIYGPLSKLISVDEKYITAIETSLGAALQNIVVEDEETAKAAIFALKAANAGRATFDPITSVKGAFQSGEVKDASRYTGYIGTADMLVRCDSEFREIVSSHLGRTVIFDNIDNATNMAKALKYKIRAVTLDGQQINHGGSFTGGSAKRDSGILSRSSEIEKLTAELLGQERELQKYENELSATDKSIKSYEDNLFSANERYRLMQTMMNAENAEYDQLVAKLDANNSLSEKLTADFEALAEARRRYDDDLEALTKSEADLTKRIDEISEFRTEKEIEKNEISDKAEELRRAQTELYIKVSETNKDIETERLFVAGSRERIDSYNAEIASFAEKIEEYERNIKIFENELVENRSKAKSGEAELERLNAERAKTEEGSLEFERKLNEIRSKIKDKTNEKELAFRSHTQNENKLQQLVGEQDKLSSRLWEEYELTRAGAVELGYPTLDSESRREASSIQTECKNKLRALGSVNVSAIEEYTEVKTRYDYMTGQIKDLTEAKDDLSKIIGKLEGEMKSAFVDSFNKINENFNKTFSELFGGGSAELQLSDPEDVLNSGIEIKAAPPGKIIKSLMQLSGGEQSFVAIALFFAILKVNPTPFCILDEIEAALDEVNVARFAEYIKRYSGGTQFILITHRRGTMEVADRLYGVTMPEHGISKVLSLNVEKIQKTEGDDWDGIFRQA